MDLTIQLTLCLAGGWGVLLFVTMARWFSIARDTLDLSLRKHRLMWLRFRWYLGLIVGIILMAIVGFILYKDANATIPKIAWAGWSLITLIEIYFLVRFQLLYKNFRKHAVYLHNTDLFSSMIAFVGSFLIIFAVI